MPCSLEVNPVVLTFLRRTWFPLLWFLALTLVILPASVILPSRWQAAAKAQVPPAVILPGDLIPDPSSGAPPATTPSPLDRAKRLALKSLQVIQPWQKKGALPEEESDPMVEAKEIPAAWVEETMAAADLAAFRQENRLPDLEVDQRLDSLAKARAKEILDGGYYVAGATRWSGTVERQARSAGIPAEVKVIEIVGFQRIKPGEEPNPGSIVMRLLASEENRKPALDPQYRYVGMGVALVPPGGMDGVIVLDQQGYTEAVSEVVIIILSTRLSP